MLLLREGYDSYLNIKKQSKNVENAFGVILKREEETYTKPMQLQIAMDNYVTKKINKLYGISFIEFMNLPRAAIFMMLTHAAKMNKVETDTLDNIEDELGDK